MLRKRYWRFCAWTKLVKEIAHSICRPFKVERMARGLLQMLFNVKEFRA